MATEFPLAGSFTTYSARFVDEPFGFVSSELGHSLRSEKANLDPPQAIGWNYCFNDVRLVAVDWLPLVLRHFGGRLCSSCASADLLPDDRSLTIIVTSQAISTAGDLTAAQVLMEYWLPNGNLNWLPSLLFLFTLVAVNLIHVRAYGEVSSALDLEG